MTTAPPTPTPTPCYPIPRPASGDDPRFCYGLALDIGKVLVQFGYPPLAAGRDVRRLHEALFSFIYQEKP
jgi:hypothetical protein